MSQQQQDLQKPTKTKEQIEREIANTNAWHKKQQEKKKKKLQEQQEQKPVEMDQKALQKAKRKQQKRLERQQMLKEQQLAKQQESAQTTITSQPKTQQLKKTQTKNEVIKEHKKVEEKQSSPKQAQQLQPKKQSKKATQSSIKQQQPKSSQVTRKLSKDSIKVIPTISKPIFTQLLTLQHHLNKSFPSASSINKPAQSRLIHKYLDQYINANDTILILSRSDSWHPLAERCTKRVYLYPNHNQFTKNNVCQNITCTYEDVAYLMEGTITKIFIEFDMVFANGTGLTQKGNQNIICMANEFKIPVVGFSGTWNFNAWNFLSLNMFINKYGQAQLQKYDIIENQQLEIIVLEIGSVIPKQISGHLQNLSKIYRGCDFNSIKW